MLPHNQRIFPELLFILLVAIRRLDKEPATVAIPKPFLRIIGIFLPVAARMMSNMIRAPAQGGVFKRPSARHQEAALDPWFAFKAAMRNQTMVADGNAQACD